METSENSYLYKKERKNPNSSNIIITLRIIQFGEIQEFNPIYKIEKNHLKISRIMIVDSKIQLGHIQTDPITKATA